MAPIQHQNTTGRPDVSSPNAPSEFFTVRGFSGNSRIREGKSGKLYVSGYFDPLDGDEQFLSLFECYFNKPAELATRIPILSGHYAVVFVTNDFKTSYLITNHYGSEPIYYSETDSGYLWSFAIRDML